MIYDLSEMTAEQLMSALKNIGSSDSEVADALRAELIQRMDLKKTCGPHYFETRCTACQKFRELVNGELCQICYGELQTKKI
jgi:rRNA maturation endonuclease Nob1